MTQIGWGASPRPPVRFLSIPNPNPNPGSKPPGPPVRYLSIPNPNPGGKPPGPPVRYLNLPNANPNPEIYAKRIIEKEIFFLYIN